MLATYVLGAFDITEHTDYLDLPPSEPQLALAPADDDSTFTSDWPADVCELVSGWLLGESVLLADWFTASLEEVSLRDSFFETESWQRQTLNI